MADILHVEVSHDAGSGEWVAQIDEHPTVEGYGQSPAEALAQLAESLGAQ